MSTRPGLPCAPPGSTLGRRGHTGEILVAAREEFADRGYNGATVRSIGSRAGVDAAMINHYFGGKAGLFQEVVHIPFDPTAGLADVLAGSREASAGGWPATCSASGSSRTSGSPSWPSCARPATTPTAGCFASTRWPG